MKLYAAVVNTYGKVGQEFVDFCSVVDTTTAERDAVEILRYYCLC